MMTSLTVHRTDLGGKPRQQTLDGTSSGTWAGPQGAGVDTVGLSAWPPGAYWKLPEAIGSC
jgi:hypothetical protein